MKIVVSQDPNNSLNELTMLTIKCDGINREFYIDIDYPAILKLSWNPDVEALDFLIIAAAVYAIDKVVARSTAEDGWSRKLDVTIPVKNAEKWNNVCNELNTAVSFLTGDTWEFSFSVASKPFTQRRSNRRVHGKGYPRTPLTSLLSGGLDSFIGALDTLDEHRDSKILFVSHYDGNVSGPASDQDDLRRLLSLRYANRISHLQVRTGVKAVKDENEDKYEFENSFRSRSLIFLGLAFYAARKVGGDIPIVIPENGPISLNMPLNASRRAACSTRTVHPHFIRSIQAVLTKAGFPNEIKNPYLLKTKGEMLEECRVPSVLKEGYQLTNSCGKAGRKTHWSNKMAKACGTCVPCLLRRAALHKIGLDNERYGNDAFLGDPANYPDVHAVIGLVRSNPSIYTIKRTLMANGRFQLSELGDCASVVRRMIDEVAKWIGDRGSDKARALAGVKAKAK